MIFVVVFSCTIIKYQSINNLQKINVQHHLQLIDINIFFAMLTLSHSQWNVSRGKM